MRALVRMWKNWRLVGMSNEAADVQDCLTFHS